MLTIDVILTAPFYQPEIPHVRTIFPPHPVPHLLCIVTEYNRSFISVPQSGHLSGSMFDE